MSLTEVFFWLTYIGGAVCALYRPALGVIVYIVVYNMNPETQWWGHNIQAIGLRSSFTIALATCVGMCINWRTMNRNENQFPIMFKLMLCFLAYCFFTSISGLQPLGSTISQMRLEKLLKVFMFVFMMIRIIRTSYEYKWMLWAWMAGTIYIGYQAWSGVGMIKHGRLSAGLGGPDFSESSGLSTHLVAMIAISGYLFYTSTSKSGKFFALLSAAFAVNTMIMTRTRNAIPGICALVVMGLLRLPKGLRLRCFFGMAAGIGLSLTLADEGWWRRMETLKEPEGDESINRRFDYWDAAVEIARDHPWGVGPGHFRVIVPEYVDYLEEGRSAHSTFFECLAETGYPGTVLFVLVILTTVWHLERSRAFGRRWVSMAEKHPDLAEEQRSLVLLATGNELALAGFMSSAMFTTRLWTEGMWLIIGMSCCLYNITQNLRVRVHEVSMRPHEEKEEDEEPQAPAVPIGIGGHR